MAKDTLWRFDKADEDGHVCGTFIKSPRSDHDPHKLRVFYRGEGLFPKTHIIENVAEDALKIIDSSVMPGLGSNRIFIVLTSDNDGSCPVGEYLKMISGKFAQQLADAKTGEDAAMASKEIETSLRQQLADTHVEKEIERMKKVKSGSGGGYEFGGETHKDESFDNL